MITRKPFTTNVPLFGRSTFYRYHLFNRPFVAHMYLLSWRGFHVRRDRYTQGDVIRVWLGWLMIYIRIWKAEQ